MASSQEQQIETIFNSFDKDKSGTIELNELKQVAQALGENIPQGELGSIVQKLDANGDGKISLDQFKFWWINGLKGKLGQLVYLQAKSMKMTQNFMKQFQSAGVDLKSFNKQSGIDMMSFTLSCGQAIADSMSLDMNIIHRGARFQWGLKDLKEQKGISWLNEKSANFIIILPSDNPNKAKEQLKAMLQMASDSGNAPFLQGGDDNPYLGIKFQPLQKKLILHVEVKETLMKLFKAPVNKFDEINSLFDDSFYFYLSGSFITNFTIDDLLDGCNLIQTLLKGFSVNISGEAPNCVIKKYRQLLQASGKVDGSMKFLLSVLMKNAFLKLKLKSPNQIQKFFQKIGIKDILNECPNLSDLLQQLSLVPQIQQMKYQSQSPKHMIYQLLKCVKQNINSGVFLNIYRCKQQFKEDNPSYRQKHSSPMLIKYSTLFITKFDVVNCLILFFYY